MKLISELNPSNLEMAKTSQYPALLGNVSFCQIASSVDGLKDFPGYIRQNPVSIRNKQFIVPYVHESFARELGGKKVIYPSCALYPYFKDRSKRFGASIFLFIYVLDGDYQRQVFVDIFFFNKGSLDRIESRMNISYSNLAVSMQKVILDCKKGEYSDAYCAMHTSKDLSSLFAGEIFAEYYQSRFFERKPGLLGFIQRQFGHLGGDKVLASTNSGAVTLVSQNSTMIALTLLVAFSPAMYGGVKWYQFTELKNEFYSLNPDSKAEHHYQLGLWEARKAYEQRKSKEITLSSISSQVLKSTLVAAKSSNFDVNLFRVDLQNSAPMVVNNTNYNVKLELGIHPKANLTNEQIVERFSKGLSASLGSSVSGSVDIWDDITLRNVDGVNMIHIRLYFNFVR